MIEVVSVEEDLDEGLAEAVVRSIDGAGVEREYEVSVGRERLDGRLLMASRQVGGPEAPRPYGTEPVYDAAAREFASLGYLVYGRQVDA